jgi:Bacterial transcriptional repressor
VFYPSRVIEELACGLLRTEPLPLALDLTVECPFGDHSHRLDERILADLLQGTKPQSSGNGGRLPSAPLETLGLSSKDEPNSLQQLGPLLGMVLKLGTHRRIIYDVRDLLCSKSTRRLQYVSEKVRANADVVAIPGDIKQYEGEGLLHARQSPEGDPPERTVSLSFFGDEAPLRAHRACGEHALQIFGRMIDSWEKMTVLPRDRGPAPADLQRVLEETYSVLWEYRFFYREFVALMRRDPELGRRYRDVRERGLANTEILLKNYIEGGVLRKTEDPTAVARLAKIFWLITEFWLPFVEAG